MRRRWTILVAVAALAACRRSVDLGGTGASSACQPCATSADCPGSTCAQFAGDSYCAPLCPNGNECASDAACLTLSNVTGDQVNACVPRGDVCGPSTATPGAGDGGAASCGALNGPSVASSCSSCSPSSRDCQPNGCYNGWYCNTTTRRCQAPPTSCASDAGAFDGGAVVTGSVGPDGGSLSRLYFGIVGDTRPAVLDDTDGYPSAIIGPVFSGLQAVHPSPPFVVSTGDYVYASPHGSEADKQLDAYLSARARYTGTFFPALGNQECAGYTDSNCGTDTSSGVTNNYQSFVSKLLAPIGKSSPYYSFDVGAADGSWTAKLIVVAANAWSSAQSSWLDAELGRATTYTFVIRHEPSYVTSAPGVSASESILSRHPYTLLIVGHAHTYQRTGTREITVGNGGAPLTGNANYGFAIASQRADGAIQIDMIDYATGQSDPAFRFAVRADGSAAP